jgi:ABC-2 type transport system ATP-binding protein
MNSAIPLAIQNVSKSFDNKTVVDNLTFDIQEGEIFGLLGPNGAGKSTLINMISGVTRLGSGEISVFGFDNQKDYLQTRRFIGVMHQEITIEQFFNVGMSLKLHSGYYGVPDDPQWRETLIDRLDLRPHLEKRFIKLSGGMKRRVMVAKALIHKPRLLILDEPTAGVDVELRRGLWDFVREINKQGTTVLLTTHYLEEAEEMCNRIAIMNHGKIVSLERTGDLLNKVGDKKLTITLSSPATNLETLNGFKFEKQDEDKKLIFQLSTNSDAGEIVGKLHQLGLSICEIDTERPDLEDVFLKLTARNIR